MPSFLERILGSRKSPPTADEYRRLQSEAEKRVERDTVAEADAWRGYDESLLDEDPAATTRARQKAQDATDSRARSEAQLVAIRAAFEAACDTEAEADRVEKRKRADQAFRATETSLPRRYAKAAAEVAAVAVEFAQAEIIIAESNRDLPAGLDPLESVEQRIRGLPSIPAKVIDEKYEDIWCYADWQQTPVERDKVAYIRTEDGVTGFFPNLWGNTTDEIRVVRRRKITRRTIPGVGKYQAAPLAAEISLPGLLPNSAPFWKPVGGPWMFSENRPQAVLAAAAELEAAAKAKPRDPRTLPEYPDQSVEWVDIDPADVDADAIAAAAGM